MAHKELESKVTFSIDDEGLELIRRKLTELKEMEFPDVTERAKKSEKAYQARQEEIDRLVVDLFVSPDYELFQGTGIDPVSMYSRDMHRLKTAIAEYLMEK